MRTTLTLDDEVADRLTRLAARRKQSFKQTVNEVLRRGLAAQERVAEPAPYRVRTFRSAFRAGVDPMKLNELSAELEIDETFGAGGS